MMRSANHPSPVPATTSTNETGELVGGCGDNKENEQEKWEEEGEFS